MAVPPGPTQGHAHQCPSTWRSSRSGCAATGPRSCSTTSGALVPELAALPPAGERRMGANPHANGGLLLRDLELPDFRDYAVAVKAPGKASSEATRVLGGYLRDVMRRNESSANFRLFGPGRDRLEPPRHRVRSHRPSVVGANRARGRPPLTRRPRDGGAERAHVPGVARGLPAHRPPRGVQLLRGVHPHRGLDVQPARQVAEGHPGDPVAQADRVAQLPALVARLAPGQQRLLAPGPGLHRPRDEQEGLDHPRVPPARRQLPAVRGRPLPSEQALRERDRGRQAARAGLPAHGRGGRALRPRHRDVGLGEQRRRDHGARRGDGLRRGHPHPRDRGRREPPAPAPSRSPGARGERGGPDAPPAGHRAPARDARRRVRRTLHRATAR